MKRKKDSIASARASKKCNEAKGKGKVDEADNQELGPYFANLPFHLTSHILLQLPIKSILICRCVCKNWKTLISKPHFTKLHFEQAPISFIIQTIAYRQVSSTLRLLESEPEKFEIGSNNRVKLEPIFKPLLQDSKSFMEKRDGMKNKFKHPLRNRGRPKLHIASFKDHDKFDVVNSCNGLLCLCDPSNRNTLVICNPITGEFIRLPEATTTPTMLYTSRLRVLGHVGFGFHPRSNEYKVIKMWTRHVRLDTKWVFEHVNLDIHTLGTPSWKNVEVDPQISIWKLNYPTCVDGALHWISFDRMQMSILCFNFENERFQSFPSPPHVFQNYRISTINMGELRGLLYICESSSSVDVTMWVMKKYGIGESWTKVYNIDTSGSPLGRPGYMGSGFCWPVKHFEEGACMMLYDSCNCFLYYEPQKYGFKVFGIHGTPEPLFTQIKIIPHIPSLTSLKDVVKGDNIEVLNIHSRRAKFKLGEEDKVLSLAEVICL